MKNWTLEGARKECPGWNLDCWPGEDGLFTAYACEKRKGVRAGRFQSGAFADRSAALAEIVEMVRRQDVDKTPAVILPVKTMAQLRALEAKKGVEAGYGIMSLWMQRAEGTRPFTSEEWERALAAALRALPDIDVKKGKSKCSK